ncbi:MAG: hypothetical protein CMO26_07645 [Thiotrichales bacterium]|nr:hypothetical protein [Thiotrichales bacterium]
MNAQASTTRSLTALVVYIAAVLVAGALLAYPVMLALIAAGQQAPEFHSVMGRCMKVLALLGLFPLMRFLGLRGSEPWGFAGPKARFFKELAWGYGFGALILLVLVLTLLALGVRVPNSRVVVSVELLVHSVVVGIVAGLIVATLEEVWFRGALHTVFSRASGAVTAVVGTALLYAWVHFLKADAAMTPDTVRWSSGLEMLGPVFASLTDVENWDSILALFVAGLFLGVLRASSVSIACCIGVHAGWVLVIKVSKDLTRLDHRSELAWMTGNYDGVIGYLAAIWLASILIAYTYWYRRRERQRRTDASG